jgi:hypothetical protein
MLRNDGGPRTLVDQRMFADRKCDLPYLNKVFLFSTPVAMEHDLDETSHMVFPVMG